MRVLMLTQFYAPVIGGEERMVEDLARELSARGHHVAVATQRIPAKTRDALDERVRVHRIPSTAGRLGRAFSDRERPQAPPVPDPEAVLALRGVIAQERPDIVHAHNWLLDSYLPVKRRSRAPLVMSLHDYSLVCATKRYLHRGGACAGPALGKCLTCASAHYGIKKGLPVGLSKRLIAPFERRAVDLFLPVSQAVADRTGLAAAGLTHRVVPNFLPEAVDGTSSPAEPDLADLPRDGYILFVGDLTTDKGIHVLLAAYRRLVAPPPLVLIGRNVEGVVPVPNVHVLGPWAREKVLAAWRRCTVAVVPSIWPEPFGLVALEAMDAGRPLIASAAGGLPEIVRDGESGLLVTPGDSESLRLALERLLRDSALRQQLSEQAPQRAREFGADAVVPRVEEAYRAAQGAVSSGG